MEEEEAIEQLCDHEGWDCLRGRIGELILQDTRRLINETDPHRVARLQGKILAYRVCQDLPQQILQEKRPPRKGKNGLESVP